MMKSEATTNAMLMTSKRYGVIQYSHTHTVQVPSEWRRGDHQHCGWLVRACIWGDEHDER